MRTDTPVTLFLKDYAPPAWWVESVDLHVAIHDGHAEVRSRLRCMRNPAVAAGALVLNGEALELISRTLDGAALDAARYVYADDLLTIAGPLLDECVLESVVRIAPDDNTQLSGLYRSRDGYFTQCEAEGFRRITFFPDRPDVMAKFSCTMEADRERFPQLLSNGNPAAAGVCADDATRHWTRWEDPYAKPCYLFALVAAKLDVLEDEFVTASGRRVRLAVYVEPGKLDQCGHAMAALKKSMRWDEERFGLEMDLDQYMIVAVGDFNMGAMENKGLNIFNTKYVLGRPDTATDADYQDIDRVVAHEYFHNWTGNRVTCRDWFQLSLKEGLTVFRDQEYGADTYSRAVTRIAEVRMLRAAQFPEDAGPMAHPVRPQSYMEIRNFYTMTVYEKGAEVVRMQHTLLGEERFQKGMQLYFERHDGQAVTCDDFVQAMQDASSVDLAQFRRWYDVAGTPVLDCHGHYENGSFTLNVKQSMSPPFHIPLAVKIGQHEQVLSIRSPEENFEFKNLSSKPVPSLVRRFSAPVILNYPYTEDELLRLMAQDDDAFNRWEAGQRLAAQIILERSGEPSPAFIAACARVLERSAEDPAFAAEALALPAESFLAEQMTVVDPDALHAARNRLRLRIAEALKAPLLAAYRANAVPGLYAPTPEAIGRRALRNICLGTLMEPGSGDIRALCYEQYAQSDNMTESFAALGFLANSEGLERDKALASFYERWQGEPLVVDKWLAVQATSRLPDTLARVRALLVHPAFDLKVPNKVYA